MDDSAEARTDRSLLITLVVALVIAAGGVTGAMLLSGSAGDPQPAAGSTDAAGRFRDPVALSERAAVPADRPLPDFTLERLGGPGSVQPADYRGEPLVLNFWATWCAPCVEEMPVLQEAADRLAGRVAFLGVNVNDDQDKALALAEELDITYDLAVEPTDTLPTEAGVYVMPTTLFVDASGTVVHAFLGPLESEQLHALVGEHLGVDADLR